MTIGSDEVHCRLGQLLEDRGMTLVQLSQIVGISYANLSVLKNNRARAIRFTTVLAICQALNCDIGELLTIRPAGHYR